jgi:hypothetical protein
MPSRSIAEMGVVRAAIQRSLARTVAIKTTLPDATPAQAERMLQEAWVTGFLEHPASSPFTTSSAARTVPSS